MNAQSNHRSGETRVAGLRQIDRELEAMPESKAKEELKERMAQIRDGARDLYF